MKKIHIYKNIRVTWCRACYSKRVDEIVEGTFQCQKCNTFHVVDGETKKQPDNVRQLKPETGD